MANFEKPSGASLERWTKELSRQEIVIGEYEYVALFGGDGTSNRLSVKANNPSIVSVKEEDPIGENHRVFKLSGLNTGNAMIEAKNSSGSVWAFMQTEVISWKPLKRYGPKIGFNGRFPDKYLPKLRGGIELAWTYYSRANFRNRFAEVIGGAAQVGGKRRHFLNPDSFGIALNRMILNYADNTNYPAVKSEISKEDIRDWIAGFTNTSNLTDVYIRGKRLEESEKLVGDTIIHESEHVSGLPGGFAEIVSVSFEAEFGIKRYNL